MLEAGNQRVPKIAAVRPVENASVIFDWMLIGRPNQQHLACGHQSFTGTCLSWNWLVPTQPLWLLAINVWGRSLPAP